MRVDYRRRHTESRFRVIITVLEWNSDSGEQPIVIVADDKPAARRAALAEIAGHLPIAAGLEIPVDAGDGEGEINYIDREWVAAHPLPDSSDDAAVRAWLDAFKEETTDLWLSLYEKGPNQPSHDATYQDVRESGY
jgi:hypothetical protein